MWQRIKEGVKRLKDIKQLEKEIGHKVNVTLEVPDPYTNEGDDNVGYEENPNVRIPD
jgi:hypothetical protein